MLQVLGSFVGGLWTRIRVYAVAAAGGVLVAGLLLFRAFTAGKDSEKNAELRASAAASRKSSQDAAKASAAADAVHNESTTGGLRDDDGFKRPDGS